MIVASASSDYDAARAMAVDARHRRCPTRICSLVQKVRRDEEGRDEQAVFGELDQADDRGVVEHPQDHFGTHADGRDARHNDRPARTECAPSQPLSQKIRRMRRASRTSPAGAHFGQERLKLSPSHRG